MRSRSRLLCSLLSLILAYTPAPARAATDGDLCSGLAMLICVPAVLVAGIASVFEPKSNYRRLASALERDDLDGAKRIVLGTGPDERLRLLDDTIGTFLRENSAANPTRLGLIASLLDERRFDLSGQLGRTMLQGVVSKRPVTVKPVDGVGDRQLALAKLFIAHGARADAVRLGECTVECNTDDEFLRTMIQAGADINRDGDDGRLYDRIVQFGNLDTAARLLTLGADPDGGIRSEGRLLRRIAVRCDLKPPVRPRSADQESYLQRCVEESVTRTRFAVTHGADPNGRVTWEQGNCETPYAVALRMQNTALADALRSLGADPEFSARCLATAPRQP